MPNTNNTRRLIVARAGDRATNDPTSSRARLKGIHLNARSVTAHRGAIGPIIDPAPGLVDRMVRRLGGGLLKLGVAAAVWLGCPGTQAVAQTPTNGIQGPFVSLLVSPLVLTNDLRTLPKVPPWKPGDPVREFEQEEDENNPPAAAASPKGGKARGHTARLVGGIATLAASPAPGVIAVFEGNQAVGVLPPDTTGEAGPNHYIQAVNTVFSIFDRQGNLLAGPSDINSLWSGFGGSCETENHGDPIVQYDHLADRWIISQFAVPGGAAGLHQCFAVSRTGDPIAGGWNLYDFTTPDFPDYPKITVWPDGYYMSSQRGFPGGGLDVYAFDRASMLVGAPAGFVHFFVAPPSIVLLPSDLDGPPPPAGTPNFFARQVDGDRFGGIDRLDVFAFSVNWAAPASSTFTALPSIPTAPFDSVLCSASFFGNCVPQPGTAVELETLTVWPMWRLQYRNFGTHESMVVNHTVDADGADHAGIRWYELRRPPAGAWSIFQQGTHAPDLGSPGLADDVHRWMGSIAMDSGGNIALGYSVSSDSVYPGIRYSGRLAGDPPGVLTLPEVTIVSGAGSQTHSSGRWGNYSSMTVDPIDGCRFWYSAEYYSSSTEAGWQTRIASFSLDTVPPIITCPASMVQPTDPGQCSAVVTYVVSAVDNCSTSSVICLPPSGSVFPKGVTAVNCTATDAAGNAATCAFNVDVQDQEKPQITCPADLTRPTDPGLCSAVVSFAVAASDNCPGVIVACVPPSGSVFPKGSSPVACTATDTSGNSSACNFRVIVEDKEAPHVECSEGTNPAGKKAPKAGKNPKSGQNPDGFYRLLATDNCDPKPKIYIRDSASSFVAGPFANGDQVKITQAPGGKPKRQRGPGVIVAHLHLRGDALLYGTDADGNVSATTPCLVPPPPK